MPWKRRYSCKMRSLGSYCLYSVTTKVYLSIWTAIDPPKPEDELVLREENGKDVDVHIQCSTKNMAWEAIAFGWEGVLICSSAAVAFLSRHIKQAFNESIVVGNVAYFSFFFLAVRLLIFFLPDSILQPSLKNLITSLILTTESLVVMGVYFGTKFYSIYKRECSCLYLMPWHLFISI